MQEGLTRSTPQDRASVGADAEPASYIAVKGLVAAYDRKVVVDNVSFDIREGEHLSLLGPSGCGKTTTLRCIAGLETPLDGEIVIAGQTVFSAASRINLPPDRRQLSMVFQSYAIWPHMTVFENVAYGLRSRGVAGEIVQTRVAQALNMVGMTEFTQRPATALSGGQQQRVALARSYAAEPRAILLDEPLSNLDARLRVRMRDELKELQRVHKLTTVYVTHDQEEAVALSDRIIVMRSGAIEQKGTPIDIYNRPRTRFVADFVGGSNIIAGKITGSDAGGAPVMRIGGTDVHCAPAAVMPNPASDGTSLAAIRTIHPALRLQSMPGQVNQWPATVKRATILGDTVSYLIEWPGGELRVSCFASGIFEEGRSVYLHIPPERIVLVESDD